MSFPLPTSTTASSSGFSFGLQTTGATATVKPFGSSAGGVVDISKLPNFSLGAGATQPVASTTGTTVLHAPIASTATTLPALGGGGFLPTGSTLVAPTPTVAPLAAVANIPSLPTLAKTTAPLLPAPVANNSSVSSTANTASTQGNFANLSTATKTTDSAAISHASQLSYNQLEEHINKWTLEFEEQEKIFTEQATQINAWDKILINNNHKIIELNNAVQKVKADQQLLEQELEFIDTQHKELEESIAPLQKEFTNLPQVDVERSQTYLLVETLDTQLKQMSEDLKEIIDSLNEANKGQDNTDPIIQIGKILNAHMCSLQWVESSSTIICNKLDDIAKMQELLKREAYRSVYYN